MLEKVCVRESTNGHILTMTIVQMSFLSCHVIVSDSFHTYLMINHAIFMRDELLANIKKTVIIESLNYQNDQLAKISFDMSSK